MNEKELNDLNRIVTMYLDYAEMQVANHNAMTTSDWVEKINALNRIVIMYLDYAEMQVANHNAMTTSDWVEKINDFLQFNGKEILHNAGKISANVTKKFAYKEYDKFKQDKLYKSDFDLLLEENQN